MALLLQALLTKPRQQCDSILNMCCLYGKGFQTNTRIELQKAAGESVLYFLYMLLHVSLQRSWTYTLKKDPAARPKMQRRIKVLWCSRLLHTKEAIMICRPSYSFITINWSTASIYYNWGLMSACFLTALYLAVACVQFPWVVVYTSL